MNKYIVGIDPYKKEPWWVLLLIKLRLRKPANTTFEIILDSDYFKTGDVLLCESKEDIKVVVIKEPKLSVWQKIKRFFGFDYIWKSIVKIVK